MKTDFSTAVLDHSKALLGKVKSRVKQKIFAGPGVMVLTPKESLARIKAMTPDERVKLVADMGEDRFMQELERLMEQAHA